MAQTAGGTYYAASSELVSSWPATSLDLANQLESRFAAKYTTGGAWTAWTPTVSSGTGTITTSTVTSATYIQVGKIVIARFDVTINNVGTGGGNLRLTTPVTPKTDSQYHGAAREIVLNGSMLWVGFESSTTLISMRKYDNTSFLINNARIIGGITFEAA